MGIDLCLFVCLHVFFPLKAFSLLGEAHPPVRPVHGSQLLVPSTMFLRGSVHLCPPHRRHATPNPSLKQGGARTGRSQERCSRGSSKRRCPLAAHALHSERGGAQQGLPKRVSPGYSHQKDTVPSSVRIPPGSAGARGGAEPASNAPGSGRGAGGHRPA